MHLTPSMQAFIRHWGDMGSKWGLNRSVAQIHALLHLSPEPLTAEDLVKELNLARSNVSTGLKELQSWRLIEPSRREGDRREYFTALGDIHDAAAAVIAARREREFVPTLTALREIEESAEQDDTPADVRARISETLNSLQNLDRWYADLNALPRIKQLSVLKIGARIGSLISDRSASSGSHYDKGSKRRRPRNR
jgi:DNA-binding transcriptional regulator GbsR (MarR family)